MIKLDKNRKYADLLEMEMYPKKPPFQALFNNMSPMEYFAIGSLLKYEQINPGEHITVNGLATLTGMLVAQVSRTLKQLEMRGLLKRVTDENCRRNTFVVISDLGRKLFNENTEAVMNYAEKVLSDFTDDEIEMMISFKKRLFKAVEQEEVK